MVRLVSGGRGASLHPLTLLCVLLLAGCYARVVPPQNVVNMGWDDTASGDSTDDDVLSPSAHAGGATACRTVRVPAAQAANHASAGGEPCVFPFVYQGRTYGACTTASSDDDDAAPFCGTRGAAADGTPTDVAGTSHIGICAPGCPTEYEDWPEGMRNAMDLQCWSTQGTKWLCRSSILGTCWKHKP